MRNYAECAAVPRDLSGCGVLRNVPRMKTPSVLTISSQVAAGPVGNSAIVPGLLALGVTPIAVPTVLHSFHPGHGTPRGMGIPVETLGEMLMGLDLEGFLEDCRCVVTGYFASAGQVEHVSQTISRLKDKGGIFYVCDPVSGDDDALYVKKDIAEAIRDRLVPLCDLLTPNVFELGWLTDGAVKDFASAEEAAQTFAGKQVIATSVLAGEGEIATVLFGDGEPLRIARPKIDEVPNGTGDLLGGLVAGHIALGRTPRDSLERCIDIVEAAIAASDGKVLNLAGGLRDLG